jgi:hypoxanthine phosphoribosyltransferase
VGRPCYARRRFHPAEETAIAPQRKQSGARRASTAPAHPRKARPAPARRPEAGASPKQGRPARSAGKRPAGESALDRTGDGFALAPGLPRRPGAKGTVREMGWGAFGEIARDLAATISAKFRPQVVVGVARGGVFVGAALSTALGAEFYPIRIERRRRDMGALPHPIVELPDLAGKRVLVVDDVAVTGATLARARAVTRKARAGEVRTGVLVARPDARPDFFALETEELVLFPWDYQLDAGGGSGDPGEVGV